MGHKKARKRATAERFRFCAWHWQFHMKSLFAKLSAVALESCRFLGLVIFLWEGHRQKKKESMAQPYKTKALKKQLKKKDSSVFSHQSLFYERKRMNMKSGALIFPGEKILCSQT